MTRIALLTCTLLLAGCQFSVGSTEEDRLENAMRETLSSRGAVQQVELTKENDNHMTGFAVIRDAAGHDNRLNCTADRDNGQGTHFTWRCQPVIDEAALTQMEDVIRQNLARQGTVEQVDMTRQDDNHMTGYALLRDSDGDEGRFSCSADRDPARGDFSWHCSPPGAPEAPADQPEPAAEPAQDDSGK
jgi:hypothetical protein